MSPVNPSTFGLQDDVPEAALDSEWRSLISQQAHTLAAMLQRLQTTMAGAAPRTDGLRLQALAADAERFLTAQAQQYVSLEHELVQLRTLVADLHPAPAELPPRVPGLERVVEVLHANLAAARRSLATLLPQVSSSVIERWRVTPQCPGTIRVAVVSATLE